MEVECIKCGLIFQADKIVGKQGKCKSCGKDFIVDSLGTPGSFEEMFFADFDPLGNEKES